MKHIKLFEQHVNEASYGQNYLYEVATPAPASILTKDLEKLFGKNKVIRQAWNSPEGFESVVMLNLSPSDVKKIKDEIADVLIFRMEITNRSEW
jgi:hypothetical protein